MAEEKDFALGGRADGQIENRSDDDFELETPKSNEWGH